MSGDPMQRVAEFTVYGEPISKSRARFTNRGSKSHSYTPERTREGERLMREAFLEVAPDHEPDSEFAYSVRALFYNGTRQRRDVDNMLKLVLDALNGHAWTDDTQVVEVSARKILVPKGEARTEVAIYEVDVTDPNLARCEQCGKGYMTYESWSGARRWCSPACRSVGMARIRKAKLTRKCERCGKEFESADARYCSMTCREQGHVDDLTCHYCNAAFRKCVSWRNKGLQFCCPEHHAAHGR
jgi:Holliday junction resolvase RusA-like endonuclease